MKKIQSFFNDKIIIVIPKNYKKLIVPLFCKLCKFPMRTKEDVEEFHKRKVCEQCSFEFQGKLPSKKSKEWQNYIQNRRLKNRAIFNLK